MAVSARLFFHEGNTVWKLAVENTTMARHLIYTVAVGERYRTFARMLVESVFRVGNWDQDVVVLSDAQECASFNPKARVLSVRDAHFSSPQDSAKMWKALISLWVDISRYDYILFLDADVLVNSPRLAEIVSQMAKSAKISVMRDEDGWCIGRNHLVTGRDLLTAAEKEKWADVAINSGVVGFSGGRFGREFLTQWSELNLKQKEGNFSDQASLYAVLLRNYAGQWRYFDDTAFCKKLATYGQTILHFTTLKDELMARYFAEVLGL